MSADARGTDVGVDDAGVDDAGAADLIPGDGWRQDWGGTLPAWCTCEASDLDDDGFVNVLDFSFFLPCFGNPGTGTCAASDFNGDGQVDLIDYQCFLEFFSNSPQC